MGLDKMKKQLRIAIIAEKVMPYRCALYRELAAVPSIDLKVFFLDKWGAEERFDPTMGVKYSWGADVLASIPHEFVANRGIFRVTYTGADRTIYEEKLGPLGGILFYMRTYFGVFTPGLLRKVLFDDFDAVIVENYSSISSVIGAVVARVSGKRVYLRGEAALRRNTKLAMRIFKQLYLRLIFKLYSGFMYSCKSNMEFYQHYGAKQSLMTFVPSAVDGNQFKLDTDDELRSRIRHELQLGASDIAIVGVGRLVPRKNWKEAIEGCAKSAFVNKNLKLILVGDGPEKEGLEQLAHELNCPVLFVGFKSQQSIVDYYQAADIIVQTSTYDPSPKVLNEALGFGLPIIVSDAVGTAGDLCIDGENGFVYPIGNIEKLAKAINELVESNSLRKSFGKASMKLNDTWSIPVGVQNIVETISKESAQC